MADSCVKDLQQIVLYTVSCQMQKLKILFISGSIRQHSSSHVIIDEMKTLLPNDFEQEVYDGLATIPAFDGREVDPIEVLSFKEKVKTAEGVIICTPEYAFGVPGALKNALDWTVSSAEFYNKPVALITASSQGEKGHESLQHTLTALSTKLREDTMLLIPFIRAKVKDGKVIDEVTRNSVAHVVSTFLHSIQFNSHS